MYSRKVTPKILYTTPNLKNVRFETKINTSKSALLKYSFMLRQITLEDTRKSFHLIRDKVRIVLEKDDFIKLIKNHLESIPRTLREQSSTVLQVWARQCECVLAQRLRRSQQMFCLYSKLWEERALRDFINRMRQNVTKRSKNLVFGAVGIAAYDWESNRIKNHEIEAHLSEFKYVYRLKERTYACKMCPSHKNDDYNGSLAFCHCTKIDDAKYDDWEPFFEHKSDFLVWRRPHESSYYEYKVYGSYSDVKAIDFLNVQIDVDYRKNWDDTVVGLEIIDTDPEADNNGDVIYWEMMWPKFFANRDYVFKRRFLVDHNSKTLVLKNRGTNHPSYPVQYGKHRVDDYWSYMVIRPYTELDKPGLEFSLTYYDNPGVSLPTVINNWVTYRAMPEFLEKMREAAIKYEDYCKTHVCKSYDMRTRRRGEKVYKDLPPPKKTCECPKPKRDPACAKSTNTGTDSNTEVIVAPTPIVQPEKGKSYWKYFLPNYFFS